MRSKYSEIRKSRHPWSAKRSKEFVLSTTEGIDELHGLRVRFTMGIHSDGGDHLILNGVISRTGSGGGDGVHNIHSGGDLAEGSILTVQVFGVLMHDEELAARRVGGLAPGHAQHTTLMLQVVFNAVVDELTLDAVAGASTRPAQKRAA